MVNCPYGSLPWNVVRARPPTRPPSTVINYFRHRDPPQMRSYVIMVTLSDAEEQAQMVTRNGSQMPIQSQDFLGGKKKNEGTRGSTFLAGAATAAAALLVAATVLSRDDSGLRLVLFLSLSFLKPGLLAGWLLVTALFCNRISPKAELFFAEKLSRFETSPSPVIAILVSLSFRYFNMRVEH